MNEIGKWLGVSHRVGPAMTYWVLPTSGIPISTDTVQAVTQAELQTEAVQERVKKWKKGTARNFDAKSSQITWPRDAVPPGRLFDPNEEDEEFLRNFNMPIDVDNLQDGDREGTDTTIEEADHPGSENYVGMQVGLRRGREGELRRATVKRRAVNEEGRPVGVGHTNPMVDTRQYEVKYEDGTMETLSANLLAENILQQVDEHGHKQRMMEEISGHHKTAKAIPMEDGWYRTDRGIRRRRMTTRGWEIGNSDVRDTAWYFGGTHIRLVGPIQVQSKYWERTHKYGIYVPKSIKEALKIDKENGNHLWENSIKEEMQNNRVAFEEFTGDVADLVGYKKITGHMVFDIKLGENFRRKSRYVADGHLTTAPASQRYSIVVSRDSVRILLMIAALNGLDLQSADIQNAFLTAPNLEKCYMQAGPEFLDEEGKIFIVKRALYGLKSAPQAFHSFLAENIEDLGFFASEADPDVWMRPAVKPDGEEFYEYILCYVNDILCISTKAMEVIKELQRKFKFKKDLIEPPENYLGAQVRQREIDGIKMWTISSFDYVKAAVQNVDDAIKNKIWSLPAKAPTPMVANFEPELDDSEELNEDDHTYYQELIGVLRWATELGRVDILFEVSLLSQYQACPRVGHMEQVTRIISYLKKKPKMSLYMDHPSIRA